MPLNIYHDHLEGFNSNYISPILSECEPGQVQVEYILPDKAKLFYPDLKIQFSAFLMVRNNHFEKFLNLPVPNFDVEKRTNFLCSFNKSKSNSRTQFLLNLFIEGLYNPEFCSKHFAISDSDWMDFIKQVPVEISSTSSLKDAVEFINTTQIHGDNSNPAIGQVRKDLKDLSPLMAKSFITAVAETVADSYVPFPTEKIFLPIATKSLWIAYAQPGYYKFIQKYLGIKPCIGIDYSFDEILDPNQRLRAVMKELKRLQQIDTQQKIDLYGINHQVFDHNFSILTSGEMISNVWRHDECSEHNKEFASLGRLASEVNTSLITQWSVAIKYFIERDKHFQRFG